MTEERHQQLQDCARSMRQFSTDAEALLWKALRNRQVAGLKFYRQRVIENFIVDFYCPALSLVIEADGGGHFEVEQAEYDRERTAYLNRLGLTVVRFTNIEILTNCEGVIQSIISHIPPQL